jgi:hypothetical protein
MHAPIPLRLAIWLAPWLPAVLGVFPGCGEQAPAVDTLQAHLRIADGQLVAGAIPADNGGPSIGHFGISSTIVRVGRGTLLNGQVPQGTTSIAVGMHGDLGYYVVLPGLADVMLPDQLDFEVPVSFSPEVGAGVITLEAHAIDAAGRVGPAQLLDVTIADPPPVEGQLVVSLSWDTEADLDLHVVLADGTEVWAQNINSYSPPPPGGTVDPDAWKSGTILDFDSNNNCVIDGRREENVYSTTRPASGHYVVRVDTFSLCGQIGARWTVKVWVSGQLIHTVQGDARPSDEILPHGAGAGATAVEFDVP